RKTELSIKFSDDSELKTEIAEDGSAKTSGPVVAWDYRRTVLRQVEVAAFIHDTKGGKYSALLPLLGLHQMEIAAENLRQVAKAMEGLSKLKEAKSALKQAEAKRKDIFGAESYKKILGRIEALHKKYCADKPAAKDATSLCANVTSAIETRTAQLSTDE